MTAWWYWALALLAALLFAGPWLLFRWEERSDRKDRETWEQLNRPLGRVTAIYEDDFGVHAECELFEKQP